MTPVRVCPALTATPANVQFPHRDRAQVMKLLSHLSPDGGGLPEPADPRQLALGFEAWNEALGLAQGEAGSGVARQWSASPLGKRLLAAIFGNSPFLSGVAVKEWALLDAPPRGRGRPGLFRHRRVRRE